MIKPIKIKIRKTDGISLFHDTRQDVQTLGKAINEIIDKVDEITEAVNKLSKDS